MEIEFRLMLKMGSRMHSIACLPIDVKTNARKNIPSTSSLDRAQTVTSRTIDSSILSASLPLASNRNNQCRHTKHRFWPQPSAVCMNNEPLFLPFNPQYQYLTFFRRRSVDVYVGCGLKHNMCVVHKRPNNRYLCC